MRILLILLITISCSAVLFAQTKSVYTSTKVNNCKPTKESTDGGYVGLCKGIGGYKLKLMEGDLRQTLNVIAPNNKETELNLWSTVSSGFSSVGEKVEWRMKGKVPKAFIVRFNASENPDDSTKITSYLVVVKLTKNATCITDVVKPSKAQNAEAQKLADSASGKACKTFE